MTETPTNESDVEPVEDEESRRRFRLRWTWADIRAIAPVMMFILWLGAALVVALARVDPWNESKSWRKWLGADQRGWEILIPGLLLAFAVFAYTRAHDRWSEEGWSPETLGMVLIGSVAGVGGLLWGLYALGMRPFTG